MFSVDLWLYLNPQKLAGITFPKIVEKATQNERLKNSDPGDLHCYPIPRGRSEIQSPVSDRIPRVPEFLDLQKGKDGLSTIHRTNTTSPSRRDMHPQHDMCRRNTDNAGTRRDDSANRKKGHSKSFGTEGDDEGLRVGRGECRGGSEGQ